MENIAARMKNRKALFLMFNILFFRDCEIFFRKIAPMDRLA